MDDWGRPGRGGSKGGEKKKGPNEDGGGEGEERK